MNPTTEEARPSELTQRGLVAFHPWRGGRVSGLGLLFASLCAVFAWSGQLFMEFHGGTGEHDTSLDPRHLALLVATSAVLLFSVCIWRTFRRRANGQRDFHRLLKLHLGQLPAGGRGPGFFFTIIATTFALGLVAHTGERSPSNAHDAIAWLLIALLVAVISAGVARFVARVLPDFIAAILAYFIAVDTQRPLVARIRGHEPIVVHRECWCPPLFSRPPPLQA